MESAWFDPNGAAGLVFYLAVVVTVVLFMTGNPLPGGIVMAIMFGIPLLLIFFREPLTRMLQKRADKMETGKAVGGSRERKSELGRRDLRKPVRLRIRRSDRRNPGAASGILRTVQPFL